jgi:transglutaminase-like putative cysteine protease
MKVWRQKSKNTAKSSTRRAHDISAAANLWLLGGLIMVVLPHFANQNPAIMACCGTLLLWRLLFDLKYAHLPPRWLKLGLAFAAFAGVGVVHHTIFGRDAGVALLLIMMCLKLMEMRIKRDFVIAVSLGYFVVITGFLYTQSMFLAAYMFATILVLTTALILSNRLDSGLLDRVNLRLAGAMLLQAMPLALLLFVLFPRLPAPMWGLPEDAFGTQTGLSDQMSPGQISRLSDNNAVAFRVQFNSPMPPPAQLYWRGPVFSYFDGKTWSGDPAIVIVDPSARYGKTAAFFRQNLSGYSDPVRYGVTLEPNNQRWLFALEMPTALPPHSHFSDRYELLANQPVTKLIHYDIRSQLKYGMEAQRLSNRHLYLQLPSNIGGKAQQLMLQLLTSMAYQDNRDEKIVAAILNYFRQQPFYYTKQPPRLDRDPIDQFLFETRKGFCEHYASAFTFLMRAAGVPARVVTGYQGGEFNTLGDYLIVRQSDAHAWSEVWLSGKGWTRVDPTAVIPTERILDNEQLQRLRSGEAAGSVNLSWLSSAWREMKFAWDNVNHTWNMWVIGYNSKRQDSFLNWLGLDGFGKQGVVVILFIVLFLLVMAAAFNLLYRNPGPRDPVQKSYQRFCRKLAVVGLRKSGNEGAAHFAQRAVSAHPELAEPIQHITRLYNGIRYAHDAEFSDKHAEAQLRDAVKAFHPRRLPSDHAAPRET